MILKKKISDLSACDWYIWIWKWLWIHFLGRQCQTVDTFPRKTMSKMIFAPLINWGLRYQEIFCSTGSKPPFQRGLLYRQAKVTSCISGKMADNSATDVSRLLNLYHLLVFITRTSFMRKEYGECWWDPGFSGEEKISNTTQAVKIYNLFNNFW